MAVETIVERNKQNSPLLSFLFQNFGMEKRKKERRSLNMYNRFFFFLIFLVSTEFACALADGMVIFI